MSTDNRTETLFVNHSSLLIRYGSDYLLLDPWFDKPAFGSWLPIPPSAAHPVYLASLGSNLKILISHGHDDHCDDRMLELFDKETSILTGNFQAPSVLNRLKKIGFNTVIACDQQGQSAGPFHVRSYLNDSVSLDDAVYSIVTPDAHIIHCNDCWFPFTEQITEELRATTQRLGGKRTLLMAQTNSASGFPLNYRGFSEEEKSTLLLKKIGNMYSSGINNSAQIGAQYFLSYAGFSAPFVKDHDEYRDLSHFPTPSFLARTFPETKNEKVQVLDMMPGDTFDFQKPNGFLKAGLDENLLKKKSIEFYLKYGIVNQCDSFESSSLELSAEELTQSLHTFLDMMNDFVKSKVARSSFHPEILGKILTIEVEGLNLNASVKFGEGRLKTENFNKKIIVQRAILEKVIQGKILFENLYTGYGAQLERQPRDVYNRDIVMYLIMFSYFYRSKRGATLKGEPNSHQQK